MTMTYFGPLLTRVSEMVKRCIRSRVADPHIFNADQDLCFFINADQDPDTVRYPVRYLVPTNLIEIF